MIGRHRAAATARGRSTVSENTAANGLHSAIGNTVGLSIYSGLASGISITSTTVSPCGSVGGTGKSKDF